MTEENTQVSATPSLEELLKAKMAESQARKEQEQKEQQELAEKEKEAQAKLDAIKAARLERQKQQEEAANLAKQLSVEEVESNIDNLNKNELTIDADEAKYKIIKNYKNMQGVIVIKSIAYKDIRGSFQELYNETIQKYLPASFIPIQDNLSKSMPNVFRGMHWDEEPYNKSKYVTCPNGKVLDIFVDMREDSSTYGKIGAVMLDNLTSVFIPDGFAHGFLAIDRSTAANMLLYKVDNGFDAKYSKSFNHASLFYRNKPNCLVAIDQEVETLLKVNFDSQFTSKKLILSEKDENAPKFEEL